MTSGYSFVSKRGEGGHWVFNLNGRGEVGESRVRIESRFFFTEIRQISHLYLKSHVQGVANVGVTGPSPRLQSLIVEPWISQTVLY